MVGDVVGVITRDQICTVDGLGNDLLEVRLNPDGQYAMAGTAAAAEAAEAGARAGDTGGDDEDGLELTCFVPLVPSIVPVIDIANGRCKIDPPEGLLELATVSEQRIRIRALLPERAQSLQAREDAGEDGPSGETRRYDNLRRR